MIPGANDRGSLRPDKAAAMQPARTEPGAGLRGGLGPGPHAGAIPDEKLESILSPVSEGIGAAVTGGFVALGHPAERLLHQQRQAIHSEAHVDRLDGQPNLVRMQCHGS